MSDLSRSQAAAPSPKSDLHRAPLVATILVEQHREQQTHPAASATLLADSRNTLGEGATWCDRTHALYWVDIEGARLWRCRADG
ncbi:SMP-30/gluconolactonase/LRE family protein, partial [Burkholderia cenocepacia]|nr:SMP-30/gluconolactonase/LRE family protein [Burkholderia cenocepacia]